MKTKVFAKLKPKAVALGFTEMELQGVAADIADNLDSDDATDEDVDARIDAALPFLKVAQKAANRTIEEARKKATKPIETESDKDDKPGSQTPSQTDNEPAWFKNYRESQEKRIAAIENQKTITSRRSQLEAIVKDAGAFGEKTLKDFGRMNFDSDESFAEYLEDTKSDAAAFKQEVADKGLSGMGKPAGGGTALKTEIDPAVKERIAERQAEMVTPAIVGLPQQTK